MLEVYEAPNYKEALKGKIKTLKSDRPGLTMKKMASHIGVQYTYLSKSFNQESVHLSEDHLFKLCKMLELDQGELEYIMLGRSHETAGDESRKEYLFNKLEENKRRKRLEVKTTEHDPAKLEQEMKYLFNPHCVLVHVALFIPAYREAPYLLTEKLAITLNKLKEILRILDVNGIVRLGEDGLEVLEILDNYIHYDRNHPLMRIHQSLFKTAINSKLLETPEDQKISQMFSFTMDDRGYHQACEEYHSFLKKVQKISKQGGNDHLYQISFDFFKWL
jgi:transcriptional regulator with XRE-family HTH domain